ncbi:MAG: hypothetical protein ACI82G_001344 [Bradymonadia bacterium]
MLQHVINPAPHTELLSMLSFVAKRLLWLTAAAFIVIAAPRDAAAQTVTAQVQVVEASNENGGVDGALSGVQGNLTRQFGQFDTFALFAQHNLVLQVGTPRRIDVPGAGNASVELLSLDGSEATLRVTIPGGSSTISTQGGLVFVGGSALPGGRLILAIQTGG